MQNTLYLILAVVATAALLLGEADVAFMASLGGALATKLKGKEDLLVDWLLMKDRHFTQKRENRFYAKLRSQRDRRTSVHGVTITPKLDRKGKYQGTVMHIVGTHEGRMIEGNIRWDKWGVMDQNIAVSSPQVCAEGDDYIKANGALTSWASRFDRGTMLQNFTDINDIDQAELTDDGVRWAKTMIRILDRRLVYRNYDRSELVVMTFEEVDNYPKEVADHILTNAIYVDDTYEWCLVSLDLQRPHRPILDAVREMGIDMTMVTFSKAAQGGEYADDIARFVAEYFEEVEGKLSVAPIKNTWFFVPEEQVDKLFKLIDVNPEHASNWVRLGANAKRTGSVQIDVTLPEGVLPEATDGTVAVCDTLPFGQGTLVMTHEGTLYFAKGVTRPQASVRISGEWRKEAAGRSPAAEFKHALPQGEATFTFNNLFSKSSAVTSLQLHAFSQKSLVNWLRGETLLMKAREAYSLASSRTAEFIKANVPSALVMRGPDNPFERAYRFEREAVRCRIAGLGLGEDEVTWLIPDHMREWVFLTRDLIEDLESQLKRKLTPGDKVNLPVLSRDPANVDASGAVSVIFGGEVAFPTDDSAIAVRADSTTWSLLAGDFDGDEALLWNRAEHDDLIALSEEHVELLNEAKTAIRLEGGKRSIGLGSVINHVETSVMLGSTKATEIGNPVNRGMRLAFEGRLDEEVPEEALDTVPRTPAGEKLKAVFKKGLPFTLRTLLAIQVQGYIDDMKHPVDAAVLSWLDKTTFKAVDYEKANLFVDLYKFKKFASADHAEVIRAWNVLKARAVEVSSNDEEPREQRALAEYLLALDAKFEELHLLHRSAGELANEIRQAGKAVFHAYLRQEVEMPKRSSVHHKHKKRVELVNEMYSAAAHAYAVAAEAEDEDAMNEAGDAMEYVRELARGFVRQGQIHPMMALAEMHKKVVFEAIEPHHAQAAMELLGGGALVLNAVEKLKVGETYSVLKLILGKSLFRDQTRKLKTLGSRVTVTSVEKMDGYWATTFAPAK